MKRFLRKTMWPFLLTYCFWGQILITLVDIFTFSKLPLERIYTHLFVLEGRLT